MESDNQHYSILDLAEIFGVNKKTIYRLIRRGRIKAVYIGTQVRISKEEVDRLKLEGTVKE